MGGPSVAELLGLDAAAWVVVLRMVRTSSPPRSMVIVSAAAWTVMIRLA